MTVCTNEVLSCYVGVVPTEGTQVSRKQYSIIFVEIMTDLFVLAFINDFEVL